jgi:hypothetical protein
MPPGTLRVPLPDVTQSVTGCIPTQSMGTIITRPLAGARNICRCWFASEDNRIIIAVYRYLTAQVFIRCKLIRIEVICVPLLLIVVLFLRVLYFEF